MTDHKLQLGDEVEPEATLSDEHVVKDSIRVELRGPDGEIKAVRRGEEEDEDEVGSPPTRAS